MSVLIAALVGWTHASGAAPFAEPESLGSGVYVFFGAREEAGRANRGHIANQGFIIAPAGVIVIDSGSSAAFGEHMLRAIRARTDKPLALVILTRPLDDAIFGATVLQQHGALVLAHEAAARLIAERCFTCLKNLTDTLGDDLMTATRVPRPDRQFSRSQPLAIAGRSLELLDYSGAAAPGSIAVWDEESGVLFAGGLASFERIPATRDGNLADWIAALHDLSARSARVVIPAHGPPGNSTRLNDVASYLSALDRRTARAYAAHVSLLDAPQSVTVPEFDGWALYATVHPRNVHHAYVAHERHMLDRP